MGNYCYVVSARRRARRWGAHGEGESVGSISCRHAHNLLKMEFITGELAAVDFIIPVVALTFCYYQKGVCEKFRPVLRGVGN